MNYFYFDQYNQEQGPVSEQQLKKLAEWKLIGPNTVIETDGGFNGVAGEIPGLFVSRNTLTKHRLPTPPSLSMSENDLAEYEREQELIKQEAERREEIRREEVRQRNEAKRQEEAKQREEWNRRQMEMNRRQEEAKRREEEAKQQAVNRTNNNQRSGSGYEGVILSVFGVFMMVVNAPVREPSYGTYYYGPYFWFGVAMFAVGCIVSAIEGLKGNMSAGSNVATGDYNSTSYHRRNRMGSAVTSLVLGILGMLAWIIPLFGLPITIVGLVLGCRSVSGDGRGMAIAGIVLNTIGLVLTVINGAIGAYLGATGQLF